MAEQKKDVKRKRWTLLDSLLSQAKPLSQEQIFDAYRQSGIKPSVPTLRKDLDIFKRALIAAKKQGMLVEGRGGMKKLQADGNDNRTRTYCYMEKGFSVLPFLKTELTDGEYRSLLSAINKLRSVLQNDKTFEEIRFAIQSRMETDYEKGPVYVDYEDNRRLKGREYRPLVYRAITEKRSLHIQYRKFNGAELEFDFHPYLLKQYNERWFVFGRKKGSRDPYTSIPLDRIVSVKADGDYSEDRPEGYLDYFRHRVGVSRKKGESVRHIVIRISDEDAWGRVTTKPLPTQAVAQAYDRKFGFGLISLDIVPNIELYTKILSWGEGIEILEDETVRSEFVALLQKISGKYPEMYH